MGVDLLDIADPTQPKLLASSADVPGFPRRVVLKGSTAYVASYNAGLQIFSFTDPNASSLQLSKTGNAVNLLLSGQVGRDYQLEYRSNFGAIDTWSLLQTVTLTNTPQSVTDSVATGGPSRFYRLRFID
jgi:hypothetical protein